MSFNRATLNRQRVVRTANERQRTPPTEVAGRRTSALRQGRTVPPRRPRPAHPDRPPPGEADGPGDREPVPRPDRRMLSARPPARLPRADLRSGIRDGGPSKARTPLQVRSGPLQYHLRQRQDATPPYPPERHGHRDRRWGAAGYRPQ